MFQIDNSTAVAAIPPPTPAGSAGYFTDGNPATGVSATILPAEFMNMLMMENLNVLAAGGITPAKGQYNQLALAIAKIVQSGAAGQASETAAGILKLSTNPQAIAGADDSTAITPLKLAQKLANYIGQATETTFGWLKIATQVIVNAGADDAAAVTAKKLANATQAQAFTAFTTSGASGALTLTPIPAITAYAAPLRFRVKFSQASTGTDTINVSGLGAKNIKQYDSTGAKIPAVFAVGLLADVEYDGVDFVLLDQLPANPLIDPWALQPVGVPIAVFDHISGMSSPPTTSTYRYIKLTASDAYNSGVLASESVTGTAPLINATALINLAGSPINGQAVRLINTERRDLRAGSSGVVQDDQFQGHTFGDGTNTIKGSPSGVSSGGEFVRLTGGGALVIMNDGTNGAPRFGNETRSRNIGATYYMRIK